MYGIITIVLSTPNEQSLVVDCVEMATERVHDDICQVVNKFAQMYEWRLKHEFPVHMPQSIWDHTANAMYMVKTTMASLPNGKEWMLSLVEKIDNVLAWDEETLTKHRNTAESMHLPLFDYVFTLFQ